MTFPGCLVPRIIAGVVLTVMIFTLFQCAAPKTTNPHVEISTRFGDIEIELYPKQAPQTVSAFLSYIDSGYYDKASFYRVLVAEDQPSYAPKSEIIQGGIWKTNPSILSKIPGIPHETTAQTRLSHVDGTVSLARLAPGSANTEFFICVGDQLGYDYGGENNEDGQGYAAFGRVVKGMHVVRRLYAAPQRDGQFNPQIYISSIRKM